MILPIRISLMCKDHLIFICMLEYRVEGFLKNGLGSLRERENQQTARFHDCEQTLAVLKARWNGFWMGEAWEAVPGPWFSHVLHAICLGLSIKKSPPGEPPDSTGAEKAQQKPSAAVGSGEQEVVLWSSQVRQLLPLSSNPLGRFS